MIVGGGGTAEDQEDFDLIYPMAHSKHGLALIINNRNFTCGMKDRAGSDVDAKALASTYKHLGFTVHTLTNQTGMHSDTADDLLKPSCHILIEINDERFIPDNRILGSYRRVLLFMPFSW